MINREKRFFMFVLFIDTIDIPSEMAIESPELVQFSKNNLIDLFNRLYLTSTYHCEWRSLNTIKNLESDSSLMANDLDQFEIKIKLSQINLKLAIEEAIEIANQLEINCFRIDEPHVHVVCYMHLRDSNWIADIWNYTYKKELSNYFSEK